MQKPDKILQPLDSETNDLIRDARPATLDNKLGSRALKCKSLRLCIDYSLERFNDVLKQLFSMWDLRTFGSP